VYLCRTELIHVLQVGFFRDDEAVEEVLKVLNVRHIAARADYRIVANRV
jgi:hypothetical protein